MVYSFDDFFHDAVEIDFVQPPNPVTSKKLIEIGPSYKDLAANLGCRKRIHWRVNPRTESALRNVSISREFLKPKPLS
jgi:hypothetical protein